MYTTGLERDNPEAIEMMQRQLGIIDAIYELAMDLRELTSDGSEMTALESAFTESPISLSNILAGGVHCASESLLMLKASLQEGTSTLIGLRVLMRTALLGGARVGYVFCPRTEDERLRNARHVMGVELASFNRAARALGEIEHIVSLKPSEENLTRIQEASKKFKPQDAVRGENAIIQGFAQYVQPRVTEKDSTVEPEVFSETLKWIWQSGSGVAHAHAWPATVPDGELLADLSIVVAAVHVAVEAATDGWTDQLPK
ncbi:hypothetical protein EDL96_05755 [Kocuria soli]|uniref:Uncharacterized protein n=1 Tax=Kocuria soli TaxID=2485125 RepID=A0A3N3ZYI1_9MICC|nr:hypothetical protein [Kocuria soli]ROZ63839.1 hypothetical protein EDL96_05755 [Kocuria soli]